MSRNAEFCIKNEESFIKNEELCIKNDDFCRADEARAVNNYMQGNTVGKGGGLDYWGPTMNIVRDPRWGRTQESVSEDPFLNGAYAANFVRGFQGADDGVSTVKAAACCKHFYAYSLEGADGFSRHNFNAVVSQRDLHETFLPAFKTCVQAGAPEQIMCSYNAVNGVPTCLDDKAQNGFLRKELGFKGLIVSDCDAVGDAFKSHHYSSSAAEATAQGIKAGCDQDCGSTYKSGNLQTALASGNLTMADVDVALGRIMTMRFNLGMFDAAALVPYTKIGNDVLDNAHGQALALAAAQESVILLKNSARMLPLNPAALKGKTIAVVGPLANSTAVEMGGKNDYCPESTVSMCEGVSKVGATHGFTVMCDDSVALANAADVVLLCVGGVLGHEGSDRANITLPEPQPALVDQMIASAGSKLVLVLVNGEPIAIDAYVNRIDTIVEAMEGGQAGGTAFADIVFGEVSPSGVLPFTMYPANFVNEIAMDSYDMRAAPGRTYRFYTGDATYVFGHGLSYVGWSAKFGATMPAAAQSTASLRAGIVLPVSVTNTGTLSATFQGNYRGAQKVVQLYLKVTKGHDSPPLKTLVAMEKVWAGKGESVNMMLNTSAIAGTCAFCVVGATGASSIAAGNAYELSVVIDTGAKALEFAVTAK